MRDFQANDRVIGSELRSALVDAPERATYVVTDTNPVAPTDLEVGCEAGAVVIDGDEVSVSAQTESVSDISGQVTQTAYRYHTVSVDATGTLVVRSSDVGEFDADALDAEPITQVTEPSHEEGEVFLGTAFQVEGAIERVFDGRYVFDSVPNSVITQGEGSGLDADTVRGKTADVDAAISEVSSERSVDVEYQNTTGGPLKVTVSVNRSSVVEISLDVGETSGDLLRYDYRDDSYGGGGVSTQSAIVPDGYYYRLNDIGDDISSVINWIEQELKII